MCMYALFIRDGTNTARYSNSQKHCQKCFIFLRLDGLWCPCCGPTFVGVWKNYKSILLQCQLIVNEEGLYYFKN